HPHRRARARHTGHEGRDRGRGGPAGGKVIVDCHGHYTTAPQALWDWRKRQVSEKSLSESQLKIGDDEIRQSLEGAQLKLQRERGSDVTFFSPRAGSMEHHVGDAAISAHWARVQNDLIHR